MRRYKEYFKISLRNILRHKRRSILIIVMIALGVGITIFLEGILEDTRQGWLKAIVHTQTGHIQIMHKGYLKKELTSPLDLLISNPKIIEDFLDKQEEILAYTKRLSFSGMIATLEKTTIFTGIGVDPVNEYEVFSLLKGVEEGESITPVKPNGGVIGVGLAEALKLKVGSNVTLITNTVAGALNAVDVEIIGLFKSGQREVDNMLLYVPLPVAYNLLDIDNVASNLILICKEMEEIPKVIRRLEDFITKGYKQEPLEIHSWEDLSALYKSVIALNNRQTKIIEIIMFFLIALAICNTMLMAVFERTREIGTLTAFGFRRKEIISLFLSESFLIGIIGAIIGVILGGLTVLSVYFIGIPFIPPGTERVVYMRPLLCLDKVIFSTILGIITAIIGGLYPSLWASKIKPAEALRFV